MTCENECTLDFETGDRYCPKVARWDNGCPFDGLETNASDDENLNNRKEPEMANEPKGNEMNYEFTGETKTVYGITLHRIRATKDNPRLGVMSGDVGGWIEQESNLSDDAWVSDDACVSGEARVFDRAQVSGDARVYGCALVSDDAWVSDDARVYGDARVFGRALVFGRARVFGRALVSGRACVFGEARVFCEACVFGRARVYGEARVFGDARVYGDATVTSEACVYGDATIKTSYDYSVFKNTWSSGRFFTYTKSNKKWSVGCFYGTGDELIKKAYADSVVSGKCYEAVVRAQEAIEHAVGVIG